MKPNLADKTCPLLKLTATQLCRLQGCYAHTRTSVADWHFAIIPSQRPPSCHLRCEQQLRSTASQTCVVRRTYSTFCDTAFAAAGPGLWNSLPSHLKEADLSYN